MSVSTMVATDLEHVVLLDERGPRRRHRAEGRRPHRGDRASTSPSPATWSTPTVACCSPGGRSPSARGPACGRTPAAATRSSARRCARPCERRLGEELGLVGRCASRWPCPTSPTGPRWTTAPSSTSCARSSSPRSKGVPTPDPDEVDDLVWVPWADLVDRGERRAVVAQPVVGRAGRGSSTTLGRRPRAWLGERAAERGQAAARPADRRHAAVDPPVADGIDGDGRPGRRRTVRSATTARPVPRRARRRETVARSIPSLGELTDEIRSLVAAGGKRLRPAFVLLGPPRHRRGARRGRAPPGRGRRAAPHLRPAPRRRDGPIGHPPRPAQRPRRRWRPPIARERRARRRRTGSGRSAAVLAGDLAYVWADELLDRTPLPPSAVAPGPGGLHRRSARR